MGRNLAPSWHELHAERSRSGNLLAWWRPHGVTVWIDSEGEPCAAFAAGEAALIAALRWSTGLIAHDLCGRPGFSAAAVKQQQLAGDLRPLPEIVDEATRAAPPFAPWWRKFGDADGGC
jgi:hypothetical protein